MRQVISRVLCRKSYFFLGLIYLDDIVADTTPAVYPRVWDEPSTHCLTLLLIRFAAPPPVAKGAVGSYPTFSPLLNPTVACFSQESADVVLSGMFSVALSVTAGYSPRSPGITRYHALRSPDFPLSANLQTAMTRPASLCFTPHFRLPYCLPLQFLVLDFLLRFGKCPYCSQLLPFPGKKASGCNPDRTLCCYSILHH